MQAERLNRCATARFDPLSGTARILIVDGDRETRTRLRDYIETNGFRATSCQGRRGDQTGAAAHALRPHRARPDAAAGRRLDICRSLRATSDIPVIILTALCDEVDRIVGLEVGADDYLAKPFNPRELLCRIKAVLRRTSLAPRAADPLGAAAYRFAGWRLDTTKRTLRNGSGSAVASSGGEFRLLA